MHFISFIFISKLLHLLRIQVNELVEVSSIMHRCVIEVDQKRSETAAVTKHRFQLSSSAPEPEAIRRVLIDRAFLFSIVTGDGTLLFSGICADP